MKKTTAIVVFADTTKSEARSKRLLPELNEKANLELLRYMTNATCQLAQQTDLPVILVNGALQSGKTFGERIHSAFQYAFDQGYENCVLIGNDCLGLNVDDLIEAAFFVQHNKTVLGPDLRGGTWVIGLNHLTFAQTDFAQFSWQKKALFAELVNHFGTENSILLSTKKDVNTSADLKAFKQLLSSDYSLNSSTYLFLHFIDALHHFYHRSSEQEANQELLFVHRRLMRAPPKVNAA